MLDPKQTFRVLIREATFTKEVLGAGVTQIRKANYAAHGVYAQSFAALSVGLERIGKLCLILDHYIDNAGSFPEFNYLKNQVGHRLELIQSHGEKIAKKRCIQFRFLSALDHPVHSSILQVLHAYADGDRYSNINVLTGGRQKDDPIAAWFECVDKLIFDTLIPQNRKECIAKKAAAAQEIISNASVFHTAETGEIIEQYSEASFRNGMYELVAPHRQFYVLQIIRYWVELLWELGSQAQSLGRQEIPFFGEIFGGFYNDDSYFKSRKTWEF
jgi:hypothetical protein